MANSKKLFGLIFSVVAFTGCAVFDRTILVPEENGVYHSIALDATDFDAQRGALRRAEKTCLKQKPEMRYVVDKQQTFYRGTSISTGPLSASNDDSAARQTIPNKKTAEDYKSVVTFHCV